MIKNFNFAALFIFIPIYLISQDQVPDLLLKCKLENTESEKYDCKCLENYLLTSNDNSVLAYSNYYSARDCEELEIDYKKKLFSDARKYWDEIGYRGYRYYYTFQFFVDYYSDLGNQNIDSIAYYHDKVVNISIEKSQDLVFNVIESYTDYSSACVRIGDYYKSIELFKELEESDWNLYMDEIDQIWYHFYKGRAFSEVSDTTILRDIIEIFKTSSNLILSSSDYKQLESLYKINVYSIGRAHLSLREYVKAEENLLEFYNYFKSSDSRYASISSSALSELYFELGNYEKSILYSQLALSSAKLDTVYNNFDGVPYLRMAYINSSLNKINISDSMFMLAIKYSKNDTFSDFDLYIENTDLLSQKTVLNSLVGLAKNRLNAHQKNNNVEIKKAQDYLKSGFNLFHEYVLDQENHNSRYENKKIGIELFEYSVLAGKLANDNKKLFNVIDRNKASIIKSELQTKLGSVKLYESNEDKLGNQNTIIQYGFTPDSLIAVTYENNTYNRSVLCHRDDLSNKVKNLNKYIVSQDDRIYRNLNDLYLILIEPLKIKGKDVIIIPDNELFQIPFGALVQDSTNNNSFLEKDLNIQYQFSTSFIQQSDIQITEHIGLSTFVPSFDKNPTNSYALVRGLSSDLELEHLPFAEEETDFINDLFSTNKKPVIKDSIFDALRNDQIFHYAGHGVTLINNPDQSFLALGSNLEKTDNKLLLSEITKARCNNEMVVLSACETGMGKIVQGEGVLSLARGFFFAGARSVISTLWSVSDRSSSTIMKNFYTHLNDGKPKDVALRQAKVDYLNTIKDPDYLHPFYWAGFVAVGDMSPVIKKSKSHIYVGFGLFLLSIFGLGFFIKRKTTTS